MASLFDLRAAGADVAVLGFEAEAPGAYGRLILGGGGNLLRIVEAKDARPEELAIRACNSGILAAAAEVLFELLAKVGAANAKGEYYLTDVVGLATESRRSVRVAFASEDDFQGVNSQAELALAEAEFQARRRRDALAGGVTMPAPETVWFAWDTQVQPGVVIEQNVVFGPGVTVETGAVIRAFSHLEGAVVRAG